MTSEPQILQGRTVADDRGVVGFVNEFSFEGVKRFYSVTNHSRGFVRAWHGHKQETKYCTSVSGCLLVCCVQIDDWDTPSLSLKVHRFVMSEHNPAVLRIPAGYANGFMSLTEGARIMFFSTSTLDESLHDDIRFPARLWDPWHVEER